MLEQITYKGMNYSIIGHGLVSDIWRQHPLKDKMPVFNPPDEEKVAICTAWLKVHAKPRKTVNSKHGSYGLKHVVEHEAGEHIPNGAFILAVYRLGYEVIPDGLRNPNAHFKASFTF